MQWRLTLDTPYSFALEPGFERDVQAADFRPDQDAFGTPANTWRDPVTGIVMLRPSFFSSGWYAGLRPLTDFRVQTANWRAIKRSGDGANLMTTAFDSGTAQSGRKSLLEILVGAAIIAINIATYDDMAWVAETNFLLGQDESFALYYNGINDGLMRRTNWFYVQWDTVGIHFSYQGVARVYQYANRNALLNTPKLIYQFEFAKPGEILNKDGHIFFLPIPGVGLLFYHAEAMPKGLVQAANVLTAVPRGHLIPLPSYADNNGIFHLWESSAVRFGMNPYWHQAIGFQNVTFAGSGTYLDAVFDPGYKPSVAPSQVAATALKTITQGITASLRKTDDSGAWTAGTDRQGRVKCLLGTSDPTYTPYLYGYGVQWSPIFNTRAPTPLVLNTVSGSGKQDKLLRLEWEDDEYARFEGKATMLLETVLGRQIAERGDSTFLVEYSSDGVVWTILFGGLAKDWDLEAVITANGWHYLATASLRDLWERFEEVHLLWQLAFDSRTVGDAFNALFTNSGFSAIGTLPPETLAKRLPPVIPGNTWRFSPRAGDSATELARTLLLFMRAQNVEWRARYDWSGQTWVLERKPRDTTTAWSLVPYTNLKNATLRIWPYGDTPNFRPEPPEGNIVLVEGMVRPDPIGERIMSAPLYNLPSLNDPSSADYLGRSKIVAYPVYPVTSQDEVNLMARRIYDAAAHRRMKSEIPIRSFTLGLGPNSYLTLLDDSLAQIGPPLWVKKRTVTVERDHQEETTLSIDSVWEGELK